MPKFSANLTMLFNEYKFLARFERAAAAGFKAIEYMFPYDWEKEQLVEAIESNGLFQVLHNLPAGKWSEGERGIACLPGREGEFQEGVGLAIEYAKALKCPALNCLVGLTPRDKSRSEINKSLVKNLLFAAESLEKEGIRLLIEALNHYDIPGFHLAHTKDSLELIQDVGHSNLYLQYDIYHMQKMEGNLIETITNHLGQIAHIQLADNPGRHEPGTGEIHFYNLLNAIDEAGYAGWIGCEYVPAGSTEDGLEWLKAYR